MKILKSSFSILAADLKPTEPGRYIPASIILATAILSLLVGLFIYFWTLNRKHSRNFESANQVAWLLIALFPALLIFLFFPGGSSVDGKLFGFSLGGAFGAFVFTWWFGTKNASEAYGNSELKEQNKQLEAELQQLKLSKPTPVPEVKTHYYRFRQLPNKRLGLVTGGIQNVTSADIWVNSENTNMQMARFYDRSISGIIRYLGAEKDPITGTASNDLIEKGLAQLMGNNLNVVPSTVLMTDSGALQRTHNVKKIFHVAAVQGEVGQGYLPIQNIGECVTNSLRKADSLELKSVAPKTILFPLMGVGTGQGDLKKLSGELLRAATSYVQINKNTTIDSILFLTWSNAELEVCQEILAGFEELVLED
ncbi:MAG: hypothetical protein KME42_10870 [Tildeniella nuda ZEHNDER 1965/U140]|jgi:O-acetyl-ADP-ribose deacetylase (regulator of RNase III)|nr:hypothetical protein [Tildeniella nuda ZEHNDER 1965/U140]